MANSAFRPLALVTAASNGIGLELARMFAQEGYSLVLVAPDPRVHDAVTACERLGGRAEAIQLDLSNRSGVRALHRMIHERPIVTASINCSIDLIAAQNAGLSALETELELVRLDVLSMVHLARLLAADMVARKRGRIVITAASLGSIPKSLLAAHTACKSFASSFAASLGAELANTGVIVNAMTPERLTRTSTVPPEWMAQPKRVRRQSPAPKTRSATH